MQNEKILDNNCKLRFEHIKKIYSGNIDAVKDFDLDVKENEFIVLVGPSGCGKSTILRMLAGLEEISEGKIYIDGKIVNDLAPSNRNIAMVFQNYALFGNLTVYENLGFSQIIRKKKSDEIYDKVENASKIVGLEDYLKRFPSQMSGGQRQRAALGRAIVKDASILLMDEPLSNLDAKLRTQTRKEIIKLHRDLKTTIVYVTHDQIEAMSMATRIVVLNDGEIMQVGTPKEVYNFPANVFVSQFIGTYSMNLLTGRIKENKFIGPSVEIELNSTDIVRLKNYTNQDITLGFRAENIKLNSQGILVNIDYSEYLGSQSIVKGRIDNQNITLVINSDMMIKEKKIDIIIDNNRLSFFDIDGNRIK